MSLTRLASLKRRRRSSPDELLQRQNLVSVIRFACGQPHWLGREADETSRHSSGTWPSRAARSQSNLTEGSGTSSRGNPRRQERAVHFP